MERRPVLVDGPPRDRLLIKLGQYRIDGRHGYVGGRQVAKRPHDSAEGAASAPSIWTVRLGEEGLVVADGRGFGVLHRLQVPEPRVRELTE